MFAQLHTALHNVIASRFVYAGTGRKVTPTAVETRKATLYRASHIFTHGTHHDGNVYLLNGRDRVLSIRPEHCDHNHVEHDGLVYYRLNVFNTRSKETYFKDLAPGQMLKVVL